MKNNVNFNFENQIYNEDCLDRFKSLPDESLDLIIADPPYFQVCGDFDFNVFETRKDYIDWCRKWITESRRVLKDTGTLIIWGGVGEKEMNIARIAIMIEDEKLFIRKNWVTQRNTRGYGTKRNYMSAREDFLFLTKKQKYTFNVPYTEEQSKRKDLGMNGKPRKNQFKRVSNVWNDITEASQSSIERCGFPTVKAIKLCKRIIETHSNEGDMVYIPFVGSGSEIIACNLLRRDVFGSEKEEKSYHLAIDRVNTLLNKFLKSNINE